MNAMIGPEATCDYVARKSAPESWHGTEPSEFYLHQPQERGGLGLEEWSCPHPSLDRKDSSDDQYCVFHTNPEDVPDDIDESEALLNALQDAGNGLDDESSEHRGQFIGATFGAIDLSGETIAATEHHDIRFDHARFRTDEEDLDFRETTFVTKGENSISFARAKFITNTESSLLFMDATFRTDGDGDVEFHDATFRTDGNGDLGFRNTMFRTDGDGDVWFSGATFRTNGDGDVWFSGATFRTDGDGNVVFSGATFRTDGEGTVWFNGAMFQTGEDGDVWFRDATFRTDGEGDVWFRDATFRTDDEGDGGGDVGFHNATFQTGNDGIVWFMHATFRTDGDGDVGFRNATLVNAYFRNVDFAAADLGGADLTGTDLREANVTDVSLNGATTCRRLNEGYVNNSFIERSYFLTRLYRFYPGSEFDSDEEWDAIARAYNQLKTVFSEHGLVGKARNMHVRERRARSLEAKATNGWFDSRYLRSLPSRVLTGYGVQVGNLMIWMVALFVLSTGIYVNAGVKDTFISNITYSVLAFTVAPPPPIPTGVGTQLMVMVETFFGTLSIVLLGYILGNREQF